MDLLPCQRMICVRGLTTVLSSISGVYVESLPIVHQLNRFLPLKLTLMTRCSFLRRALAMENSNDYGCVFFDETVIVGVIMSTAAPVFSFLLYKLLRVKDAFKLQREFIWVFIGTWTLIREKTAFVRVVHILGDVDDFGC